MKLLFIFGAHAAGKMTVGQALSRITPMKLFHNHMTIEPVIELFGAYNGAVTERLRQVIFEEFAKSGVMNPTLAVWIPNMIYAVIAVYLYRKAPK